MKQILLCLVMFSSFAMADRLDCAQKVAGTLRGSNSKAEESDFAICDQGFTPAQIQLGIKCVEQTRDLNFIFPSGILTACASGQTNPEKVVLDRSCYETLKQITFPLFSPWPGLFHSYTTYRRAIPSIHAYEFCSSSPDPARLSARFSRNFNELLAAGAISIEDKYHYEQAAGDSAFKLSGVSDWLASDLIKLLTATDTMDPALVACMVKYEKESVLTLGEKTSACTPKP